MVWDQIEGAWKQMRGKVRDQWGRLTEDDLDVIAGKRDQLIGRLQLRYGRARDQIEREIEEFEQRFLDPTASGPNRLA
jgi:uncharacterized protein YjbJ (UPF0337 family)